MGTRVVKVPFWWRRRLQKNPVQWAGHALQALGDTIALPLPHSGSQVVISSAPIVRDLFQANMLAGRAENPMIPFWGLGAPQLHDGEALTASRRVVSVALEPLLGNPAREILAKETGRAVSLIQSSQHRDIDLLRVCRSVYYRTALRVLVGAKDGKGESLQRQAVLCDEIAENPANVLTGEPSARAMSAVMQLRSQWRASLVDSGGVIPQLYRQVVAGRVSGVDCRDIAPEVYFEAILGSILFSIEPVAHAAATTLDYCLRNSISTPSEEFQSCIRRDPPIPFFARTATAETPIPLPSGHILRRGDRVLLHLPSVFENDPHSPYHDAFGIGAHRCVGSAVGVAYLRGTLDPLFKAICIMMPSPARGKPLHLVLALAAANRAHPWRRA